MRLIPWGLIVIAQTPWAVECAGGVNMCGLVSLIPVSYSTSTSKEQAQAPMAMRPCPAGIGRDEIVRTRGVENNAAAHSR